ncbi:tyrosine-type recombinase/integrase, partial [Flindersiella endophytica]
MSARRRWRCLVSGLGREIDAKTAVQRLGNSAAALVAEYPHGQRRSGLLKISRVHPDAISPELWTRDMAAEYVADTLSAVHGQWAPNNRNRSRWGQPLSAGGKAQRMDCLRGFFCDLIEWEWIKPRFDPRQVLSLPLSVRAQMGPNPRIIDDVAWAKLMAAGLTLNVEDVKEYGTPSSRETAGSRRLFYPIEMVRALVGVWLFAGCRVDEIRRLEVDCISWDQGRDESTGQTYPICLLHVPQNKTSPAFTKPVDPIVGQLINAWKHVRPAQPLLEDRKTGQRREFLFCYRAQLIGKGYVNDTVLPALCGKAGIPESDSRGALTSHRARATIATQLLNAPEPLSLADLKEWLGTSTTPAPGTTRRSCNANCRPPTARPTTSPATCAPSRYSSTGRPSCPAPRPAASSRGSTTTSATGTAPTTSSPHAHTGSPAPTARSTSP